jgi:hypothetical protein
VHLVAELLEHFFGCIGRRSVLEGEHRLVLGRVSELRAFAFPPLSELAAIRAQEQQTIAGLAEHGMDIGDEVRVSRKSWIEFAVPDWWWQLDRGIADCHLASGGNWTMKEGDDENCGESHHPLPILVFLVS